MATPKSANCNSARLLRYKCAAHVLKQFGLSGKLKRPQNASLTEVFFVEDKFILRARALNDSVIENFNYEQKVLSIVSPIFEINLQINFPCPILSTAGEKFVIYQNRFWTVYPRINGTILGNWYEIDLATNETNDFLLRELRKLHYKSRNVASGSLIRRNFLLDTLAPLLPVCASLLSSQASQRLNEAFNSTKKFYSSYPDTESVFVHGDYHHGNVLVNSDMQIIALLDLDWCRFGHRIDDLAFSVMMFLRTQKRSPSDISWNEILLSLNTYDANISTGELDQIKDCIILYGALDLAMFSQAYSERAQFWAKYQLPFLESLCRM